ncbi:MAG TPA: GAF and ANTAR domain-containing protein [Pseudonocardia sp.]|jgi:GAF domain-containing protein|nr:GAF and ANTAR domain-containing protein [Pseudonocardia sp.]
MDPPDTAEHFADVLLELTDTLGEEFDTAGLLHHLATACTQLLDVDAAGVLLLAEDGRLVPVAATDVIIDRLGHLEAETGAGPGLESVRARKCVNCPDLGREDERWSLFARQAHGKGFRAVHAVPMCLHSDVVGGLLLFSQRPGMLSDVDRRTVGQLAAAAATGLVHRREVHHLETVNGQLRQALTSRIAIEQAKGFLIARLDLAPEAAFVLLRAYSRRTRQRLTNVAEAVVNQRIELN